MYLAYVDKLGVLRAQTMLPEKAIGSKKEVTKCSIVSKIQWFSIPLKTRQDKIKDKTRQDNDKRTMTIKNRMERRVVN